ncbi:MAG: hypothetical protein ABJG78_13745 [Cyclobacteriaceae bacterium]
MGNATKIKNWCEKELSPMAWPLIAMRALPEIMAEGKDVSLINIDERTEFEPDVIKVINKCISEAYQVTMPADILSLDGRAKESVSQEKTGTIEDRPGVKERLKMAFKILFNRG